MLTDAIEFKLVLQLIGAVLAVYWLAFPILVIRRLDKIIRILSAPPMPPGLEPPQ